ncbi:MAG: hypothetical protein GY944_25665 [bacterium]|nr:hypothetical protein [bacterium]
MALHDYIASYVISSGDGDRCGLHELLAAIGTRRSELDADEVLHACRDTCLSLVDAGHVRFEMTPAGADRPTRDGYTLIAAEDTHEILQGREAWTSPSDAHPRYWLVATDTGKAAFISEEVVSL